MTNPTKHSPKDDYRTGDDLPNLTNAPDTVTIFYEVFLEVSGRFDFDSGEIDGLDILHRGESIYELLSEDQIYDIEKLAWEERKK